MFNIVNRGRKKAPLPVMLAHSVYDKCKSRELMTSMQHAGFIDSYYSNRRARCQLAGYTLKKCGNDKLPIPSHMNREEFCIAATDNFDHKDKSSMSGTKDDHDSVVVIFQKVNPSNPETRKEKVSDLLPLPSAARTNQLLECQKIIPYTFKKADRKKDPLPQEVKAVKNPHYEDDGREQILSIARSASFKSKGTSGITSQDEIKQKMPTWLGTYTLISDRTVPLKKVGFAPIIPSPITKHDTVFTIL